MAAAQPIPATPRGESADEVRERILEAAGVRFERYGFNKTTMSEIAGDCAMSAANLYRYFENKGEIAADGAARWLNETTRLIAEVAARGELDPVERLRLMVGVRLRRIAELASRHPHLDELVDHVCRQRPDLLAAYQEGIRALIAEVLDDGARAGAFEFDDAKDCAEAMDAATAMFRHHQLVREQPLEELERGAERVMALLVRGLSRR